MKAVAAAAAVIAAIALVGTLDADDADQQLEQYCKEVAIWQAEAARGIPPEQRTGHPDWRGIAAAQCPGLHPAE